MAPRRYVFTLNNWVPEDEARLNLLAPSCKYIVWGRETGDSGTPHLQGFVIFNSSVIFDTAKRRLGDRCHLEPARGSSKQAADYCKKDGDFTEHGDAPTQQGKRSDWEIYKEFVEEHGCVPSRREIILNFPGLWARYKKACIEYAEALTPPPVLVETEPRTGWQTRVAGIMGDAPNDRTITFVVDTEGNSGKSWMCRYALTKYPERAQVMRIGKRDDLAHVIDVDKDLFLVDVPRDQMIYLQYSVLESLKDRMIFSPKYDSCLKILKKTPTVIVFSNEEPDMEKLTVDRYHIIRI